MLVCKVIFIESPIVMLSSLFSVNFSRLNLSSWFKIAKIFCIFGDTVGASAAGASGAGVIMF
jgi:hypothetical protein